MRADCLLPPIRWWVPVGWLLGFSLGVVHMRMWCLVLSVVCCSRYPADCSIQFLPFASEVFIVWVCPPSPQLDHPPGSPRATLLKSTCRLLDIVSRARVPSKSNLWPDSRQWRAMADWITFPSLIAISCSSSHCFKFLPVSPMYNWLQSLHDEQKQQQSLPAIWP